MNRRDFIKLAGAGVAAAALVDPYLPISEAIAPPSAKPEPLIEWEENDILHAQREAYLEWRMKLEEKMLFGPEDVSAMAVDSDAFYYTIANPDGTQDLWRNGELLLADCYNPLLLSSCGLLSVPLLT